MLATKEAHKGEQFHSRALPNDERHGVQSDDVHHDPLKTSPIPPLAELACLKLNLLHVLIDLVAAGLVEGPATPNLRRMEER